MDVNRIKDPESAPTTNVKDSFLTLRDKKILLRQTKIIKPADIMDNLEKKKIIENYIQSYNTFDVKGMTKHLHEQVVFENITNGQVDLSTQGIEEFRKQAEMARGYFSQREQKVLSWDFPDGLVVIHIDYTAVLAVALPNGMKPGETLQLKGQSIFEFKDGQIVKIQDKS